MSCPILTPYTYQAEDYRLNLRPFFSPLAERSFDPFLVRDVDTSANIQSRMDLYRYFHPHHNPKLRNKSIRLIELGELEQAAIELRKSIHRAQVRTESAAVGGIRPEHFSDVLVALDYAVDTLQALSCAHPGDDTSTLNSLLGERENAPGWENWSRLLKQRLELLDKCKPDIKQEENSAELEPALVE